MYRRGAKRLLDILGALIGLAIGSVPLLAIAVLVRRRMGSPVLYRAARAGLHATPFVLYKFRTMTDAVDSAGKPLPDRDRITPLGRLLRRTSLDELPQLFNVLKGDMSLVGPRPLYLTYLPLYTAEQGRRHDVRPGITGLAQVSGRNALTWERRFSLDVHYVDHVSFPLDARILVQTIVRVLRCDSVNADGDLDLPWFMGSPASRAHDAGSRD
jgi:lipopolysaccharide/colanic/teichoic acid biosynthesis glycosyltransferase